MGITYDDWGFVEKIRPDGQARANRISKGDQIMKVGTEHYSKDAVIQAENSGSDYEVTFKVCVNWHTSCTERSSTIYPLGKDAILGDKKYGERVIILHLAKGLLFFGSAFQIQERVEQAVYQAAHTKDGAALRVLVLDLTNIEDSEISGIKVLHFIMQELANEHGFTVLFVGLRARVRKKLVRFCGGSEQAYSFKKGGEIGITCDDEGNVLKVSADGPAHTKGIREGNQIVKVGNERYSQDVLRRAEQKSGVGYEITVSDTLSTYKNMNDALRYVENYLFNCHSQDGGNFEGTNRNRSLSEVDEILKRIVGDSDFLPVARDVHSWLNKYTKEYDAEQVLPCLVDALICRKLKKGEDICITSSSDENVNNELDKRSPLIWVLSGRVDLLHDVKGVSEKAKTEVIEYSGAGKIAKKPGDILQIAEVDEARKNFVCAGPLDTFRHFFGAFQLPPATARVVSDGATVALLSYAKFDLMPRDIARMLEHYAARKQYVWKAMSRA